MKVNVLSLLSLSLISTFSTSSYAVEGGTSLTWSEHPYLIESNCTGTVFAGKFVLTAGHCANNYASLADGSQRNMITRTEANGVDIAVWTLDATVPMDRAIFIADLNDNANIVNLDDNVSLMGFGQFIDKAPRLERADVYVTDAIDGDMRISYSSVVGHSVPGDSGAPVSNTENQVVGVHYAGSGYGNGIGDIANWNGNSVNLRFVKDWLLQSIDSWHSVTELKFTGDTTIEVQSLHTSQIDMSERWNDGSLTAGDVTVTGGSCVTDGAVSFGICTLELSSGGGAGKVILESGNEITVNRAINNGGDSSSGGSMGAFSILALLAISLRRVFSKTAR